MSNYISHFFCRRNYLSLPCTLTGLVYHCQEWKFLDKISVCTNLCNFPFFSQRWERMSILLLNINSRRPDMRHWIVSSLVRVLGWDIFRFKSLPKPVSTPSQLGNEEPTSMIFESKYVLMEMNLMTWSSRCRSDYFCLSVLKQKKRWL